MLIYLSVLVALVGLLMFALSNNGKVSEAGRLMFFAGLLVSLLQVSPHVVGLLR